MVGSIKIAAVQGSNLVIEHVAWIMSFAFLKSISLEWNEMNDPF